MNLTVITDNGATIKPLSVIKTFHPYIILFIYRCFLFQQVTDKLHIVVPCRDGEGAFIRLSHACLEACTHSRKTAYWRERMVNVHMRAFDECLQVIKTLPTSYDFFYLAVVRTHLEKAITASLPE